MRKKLERVIRRRYGMLFGSYLRKVQLHEITCDALDRYDEELHNGASEQAAYEAALSSVGDLKRIHKAPVRHPNPVHVILYAVFGIVSALAVTGCILVQMWFFVAVSVICAVVAGIALYRLLSGNYESKGKTIAALAVSGYILVSLACVMAYLLLMLAAGRSAERHPSVHDYTEYAPQIESISYIEVTHLKYGKEADEFEYDVLETVNDDRKDELLKDLSELEYVFYPEPSDLYEGCHGLLLCFKEGSGDIRYVLYCRPKFNVIYQTEKGFRFDGNYGIASTEEWNAILDRYLKQDYGFQEYDR